MWVTATTPNQKLNKQICDVFCLPNTGKKTLLWNTVIWQGKLQRQTKNSKQKLPDLARIQSNKIHFRQDTALKLHLYLPKARGLDLNFQDWVLRTQATAPVPKVLSICVKASQKQRRGLPSSPQHGWHGGSFIAFLIWFYWAINKKTQMHLLIDMKIINKSLIRAWRKKHALKSSEEPRFTAVSGSLELYSIWFVALRFIGTNFCI